MVRPMLSAARRQRILQLLAAQGQIEASRLVTELSCSSKTIRRDLETLEQAGNLRRVHGGAVATGSPALPPVSRRADRARRAKETVATLAAERVPAGGLIYLGGGSTMLALAVRLVDLPKRTVFVTNMLDIVQVLGRDGRHEIHLAGGQFDPPTHTVDGPETYRFLETRMFDLAVFGATAISEGQGVMGPTVSHVALADVFRRRAHRRMVVADSTKFGRTDRYALLGFDEINEVVTEQFPPLPFPKLIANAGATLVCTGSPQSG
jgi:DeoR/GlpR family transcriptional regulator of sugar metabolism